MVCLIVRQLKYLKLCSIVIGMVFILKHDDSVAISGFSRESNHIVLTNKGELEILDSNFILGSKHVIKLYEIN